MTLSDQITPVSWSWSRGGATNTNSITLITTARERAAVAMLKDMGPTEIHFEAKAKLLAVLDGKQ